MAVAKKTLQVVVTAKDNLSSVLKGIGSSVNTLGSGLANGLKTAATAALGLSAAIVGIGTALGGVALKDAVDFDEKMRNVDSIAKLTKDDFEALEEQVLELSKVLPQTAEQLAESLYDIYSSGFQGSVALEILEVAAKGASAGITDTSTSGKGLMAVMNAYGRKTGPDAVAIMDVLFQTVNRGVITFEDLSQNIGDVTAISALLKIPIEEVGAGFAVLTKNGISGAESATALASVMRSMLKPSDEAQTIARQLGLEWNTAGLKAHGLAGMMQQLVEKTKGNEEQMAALAGDARAIKGVFILAKDGAKAFNEELTYMKDASGATQAALERQAQGTKYQFRILMNNWKALGITIQLKALPHINKFLGALLEFTQDKGPGFVKTMISLNDVVRDVFERIWKVVGPVFEKITKYIRSHSQQIKGFFYRLLDHALYVFRTITTTVGPYVLSFVDFVLSNYNRIFDWWDSAVSIIGGYAERIFGGLERRMDQFKSFVVAKWEELKNLLGGSLDELKAKMEAHPILTAALAGAITGLLTPAILGILGPIALVIAKYGLLAAAGGLIGAGIATVKTAWEENWGGIQDKTRTAIEYITKKYDELLPKITEFIDKARFKFTWWYEWMKFQVMKLRQKFGDEFELLGENTWAVLDTIKDKSKEVWAATKPQLDALGEAFGNLGEAILGLGGEGMGILNNFATVFGEGLKVAMPIIVNAFTGMVNTLTTLIEKTKEFLGLVQGKGDTKDVAFWGDFMNPNSKYNVGNSASDWIAKGIGKPEWSPFYQGYAKGGVVPGMGYGDTVPAMLTPGEEVLTKSDPRHAANGGGGMTVIINNPTVRNDGDLQRMAKIVSAALHREYKRVAVGMPA